MRQLVTSLADATSESCRNPSDLGQCCKWSSWIFHLGDAQSPLHDERRFDMRTTSILSISFTTWKYLFYELSLVFDQRMRHLHFFALCVLQILSFHRFFIAISCLFLCTGCWLFAKRYCIYNESFGNRVFSLIGQANSRSNAKNETFYRLRRNTPWWNTK